jgi:hypothetical protein
VHAWDLPDPPEPGSVDTERYSRLLLRAAGTVLAPFGISEERLRNWLFSNAAYAAPPGALPTKTGSAPSWQLAGLPLWGTCTRSIDHLLPQDYNHLQS